MEPWFLSFRTTLAYFDQFSHPLTATELWNFLWQPPQTITWNEYVNILNQAVEAGQIAASNGYYFLPGREIVVESRQRAQVLVERKLIIARKAASVLSLVPGVEAIFVCNTVAAGWPSVHSDIDVLVIVKQGRLWLTRFLFTITTVLLTKRRHDHRIADHLCLSFYIARDQLNLSVVRGPSPDIYLIYWLQQLIFLAGDKSIPHELAKANEWVRKYTPHYNPAQFGIEPLVKVHILGKIFKMTGELLSLNVFEKMARIVQKRKIDAQAHAPAPAVVVTDTMLKFHETDRREQYQKIWQEKLK